LANGREWALDLLMVGRGAGDPALPFLVQDRVGRAERIPGTGSSAQPFGVTGIAGLVVLTDSLSRIGRALEILHGAGTPVAPRHAGAFAARRFSGGKAWIDVLEVGPQPSPLRAHLEARGGGLYEAVLASGSSRLLDTAQTHGARIQVEDFTES